MRRIVRLLAILAFGFVLGGTSVGVALQTRAASSSGLFRPGSGVASGQGHPSAAVAPVPTQPPVAPVPLVGGARALVDEDQLAAIFDQASPAVVNVRVRTAPSPESSQVPEQGTGSGFIIDQQGHIVTNNHVVEDATRVEVTLADGTRLAAQVIGRDRLGDLAVIRVEAPPDKLKPLPLGDPSGLRVGNLAVAIGNPFGFERTMTVGIVSGLGRPVEGTGRRPFTDLIQTDAAINPGNSGGPLLNSRGEVVGINTFIDRRFVSVGFAVSVSTLKKALPDLLAGREVRHPWLGISGSAITLGLAERLNLPVQEGVLVSEVAAGGPAARAGLRAGARDGRGADIIVAVDGQKVTRVSDMVAYIESKGVGERVTLHVLRDGTPIELVVELGNFPEGLR